MAKVWGYKADSTVILFELAPGEDLPDGFEDHPRVIRDKSLHTGEKLTELAGNTARAPMTLEQYYAEHSDDADLGEVGEDDEGQENVADLGNENFGDDDDPMATKKTRLRPKKV